MSTAFDIQSTAEPVSSAPGRKTTDQTGIGSNNLQADIELLKEINYSQLISGLLPELLHEANNELAILQGSGELLIRAKTPPTLEQLERRGQSLLKASHRLARLCHLLERNPAGTLSPTSCELTTVFQSLHDELTMLNEFDRISWRLELSEPLSTECPGWVVKQIILNLCVNSIRILTVNGASGEIVTQFTSSESEVAFHWRDSGPGFVEEQLPLLGREQFPAENGRMGVGLLVCTKLAEACGGTISCQSGPGAMVSVTLPRVSQL